MIASEPNLEHFVPTSAKFDCLSDPVLAMNSQMVLVLTAATLFYVAFTDLKQFTIRNELILVLAGLFLLHAVLSGRWTQLHWNIGFAALMFLIMLYYYSQNLMGGGDLKLLTVAFLWTGPFNALPFAILLAVFVGIHIVLVKFNWANAQRINGSARIPLAPSIAGALIALFALDAYIWRFLDAMARLWNSFR
jgi:prepilin peptidase CpaA